MALFRPYKHEPTTPESEESSTPRLDTARARSDPAPPVAPARPGRRARTGSPAGTATGTEDGTDTATGATTTDDTTTGQTEGPQQPAPARPQARAPKARPTPSRREAEAARRERLNPSISKKEARRRSAEANRRTRVEQMAARDSTPAKVLLRDHIDARFSLGQLLLPALLLIVMTTFAQTFFPQAVLWSTVAMYVFLALVVLDFVRMWRGFRRLAEERRVPLERGLRMYGINRTIQIRRMRLPRPRVTRGQAY